MSLLWNRLKPLLRPALAQAGDLFTVDDVWAAVQKGQAQFWPAANSVVITEIKVYPRGKVLHVWLAGGRLEEIMVLTGYIKRFAKEQGCDRITMHGRRGWAKILGMRPDAVVLSDIL